MLRTSLSISASALACTLLLPSASSATDWPMFGVSVDNHADNSAETTVNVRNVSKLAPKWVATTGGDVSARAAVVNGVAYVPDWGGNLWAFDVSTGKTIWHTTMVRYGFPKGTISRTTPAVDNGVVYFGTQGGASMVAVDAATGALKWHTQIDAHPATVITSSPAIANGVLYLGVASTEEGLAADPSYPCCSFRGSVAAVNAATGQIVWKTFIVPTGYTGGAVWGSNLVVDSVRSKIFLGTGNNYTITSDPAYTACINGAEPPKAARRVRTISTRWSRST